MSSKIGFFALISVLFLFFACDENRKNNNQSSPPNPPKITALSDSFATVQLVPYRAKNGKWGLSTLAHQVVLPCLYDEVKIEADAPELLFVREKEYWFGYNRKGELVVPEGYREVKVEGNFLILEGNQENTGVLRHSITNKNIISGYRHYKIENAWVIASKSKTVSGDNIFDTTGRKIDSLSYEFMGKVVQNDNYIAFSQSLPNFAILSFEKGKISGFHFPQFIDNANDYWVETSSGDTTSYFNMEGKLLQQFNRNATIRPDMYDSLLILLNTEYLLHNDTDTFNYGKAISINNNTYPIIYKRLNDKYRINSRAVVFSLDSGNTYNIIYNSFIVKSTQKRLAISKAELADIVGFFAPLPDVYLVKKNKKLGIWSAKTKEMLVPAEYTNAYPIKESHAFLTLNSEDKNSVPHKDKVLLCSNSKYLLFDPATQSTKELKNLNKVGLNKATTDTYNFVDVENLFGDILIISDDDSNHYLYDMSVEKVIEVFNCSTIRVANYEKQYIWILDYLHQPEVPENKSQYQLVKIANQRAEKISEPIRIKDRNYLGIAWSSGVFEEKNLQDDINSQSNVLFRNIKGDTLATFGRIDVSTYSGGIIEKNKIIYDTQMVKGKYKPRGQLMVENNIIIDNYYIEKEHRFERLYIDWSGKPYAEE
jgi:hypothetical protein